MLVVLRPGEKVEVQFHESDGAIVVKFDHDAIRVETDWPDTEGRVNVIYEEKFVTEVDEKLEEPPVNHE